MNPNTQLATMNSNTQLATMNPNTQLATMNPNTTLTSKKYKTLGELLVAPMKSIILVTGKERNNAVREYLCSWLYANHYENKPMVGNLTQRIKVFDNIPCYQYIIKNAFNNVDIMKDNVSFRYILNVNSVKFIKKIHSIEPRLNGSFLNYLIRRLICEIIDKEFYDQRANDLCQNISLDKKEELNLEDKKEDKKEELNLEDKKELNSLLDNISLSYTKCKDMSCRTKDIIKDIFMISLSHGISFGWKPDNIKINAIISLLSNDCEILIDSLKKLCNDIIPSDRTDILLNPLLEYNIPELNKSIPADCDIIINNVIYSIKCTKDIKSIHDFLQLLGYSALVDCSPTLNKRIEHITILNLLEGCIVSYDITSFNKEHMLNYLRILTK